MSSETCKCDIFFSSYVFNSPLIFCFVFIFSEGLIDSQDLQSKQGVTSVFCNLESLREYLFNHPKSGKLLKSMDDIDLKKKLRIVSSAAIDELVNECGLYPNMEKLVRLSQLMGQLLDQPPKVLFDRKSCTGFIWQTLKYRRKQMYRSKISHSLPKVSKFQAVRRTCDRQANGNFCSLYNGFVFCMSV